jgi:hypothetical protein
MRSIVAEKACYVKRLSLALVSAKMAAQNGIVALNFTLIIAVHHLRRMGFAVRIGSMVSRVLMQSMRFLRVIDIVPSSKD